MLTLETGGRKCPKTFFEVLERQKIKNQTIFEFYTDDNKSKFLAILWTFLNLQKNYETPHQVNFHSCYYWIWKIPNREKISYKHFNLCEAEIVLDEIIKSINYETNNKLPHKDGLTAEFYRHFSNELAPVLLGVYDPFMFHDCYL